jgi:hypothetical protein
MGVSPVPRPSGRGPRMTRSQPAIVQAVSRANGVGYGLIGSGAETCPDRAAQSPLRISAAADVASH